MKKIPHFTEIYSQLIAIPTVISADPVFDLSNKALIELLADWLISLGFRTRNFTY